MRCFERNNEMRSFRSISADVNNFLFQIYEISMQCESAERQNWQLPVRTQYPTISFAFPIGKRGNSKCICTTKMFWYICCVCIFLLNTLTFLIGVRGRLIYFGVGGTSRALSEFRGQGVCVWVSLVSIDFPMIFFCQGALRGR